MKKPVPNVKVDITYQQIVAASPKVNGLGLPENLLAIDNMGQLVLLTWSVADGAPIVVASPVPSYGNPEALYPRGQTLEEQELLEDEADRRSAEKAIAEMRKMGKSPIPLSEVLPELTKAAEPVVEKADEKVEE